MKNVLFLYSNSSLKIEDSFYKSLGKIDLVKYQKYSFKRKKSLLIGRKLLKIGLTKLGINKPINKIIFTDRMKPYFDDSNIQFSISHSNNLVCCVLTLDNIKVGVDTEYKHSKEIRNPSSFFNKKEACLINLDKNLILDFWTKKEAILKACSSHIFEMNKIDCSVDHPYYYGEYWIDTKIECHEDYITRLMTNKMINITNIHVC